MQSKQIPYQFIKYICVDYDVSVTASPTQPEVQQEVKEAIVEIKRDQIVDPKPEIIQMKPRNHQTEKRRAGILKSTTGIGAITEEDQDQN